MVAKARSLAPRHTGQTSSGIRKRPYKNGATVESWVPGDFKQNMWANRTDPFRSFVWKNGNRKYKIKPGTRGLYGRSPAHFTWTGTPRFFHFATVHTRRIYPRLFQKNTQKALRVNIT